MRLDRYLCFVRLIKSRTLAQALIDQRRTRIDGRRVEKPSEPIRLGSVITFPQHETVRVIRVLALPVRRGPAAEARSCYAELGVDDDAAPA